MKKVMLTLAVVAFVASLASCSKTCTCTTYAPGMPDVVEEDVDPGEGKCSDMNTVIEVAGMKTGVECQ